MIATLSGSLPGADPYVAAAGMLGEIRAPHLPVLPELGGGHRTDSTGRTAVMLTALPVDAQPYGWRLTGTTTGTESLHARHAGAWFTQTLNCLVDAAGEADIALPELAVRVLGPVSLAARLWLPGGERALRDHGARGDITASWADGVANTMQRVHQVTGARITAVIDEPEAVNVLTGQVPTASGYYTVRSLDPNELRSHWQTAIEALTDAADMAIGGIIFAPDLQHGSVADQQRLLPHLIDVLPPQPSEDASETVSAPRYGMVLPQAPLDGVAARADVWDTIAELVETGRTVHLKLPWRGLNTTDPALQAQSLQHTWERIGIESDLLAQLRITAPELGQLPLDEAARALDRVRQIAERASQPL